MDYKKLAKYRSLHNPFSRHIGIEILEIGEGTSMTQIIVKPEHLNPIGSVHGGVLSTMADSTGGAAAVSHGMQVTTMNCSINYLNPGLGTTKLVGKANVIKNGKRICVVAVTIEDQDALTLCTAVYTYVNLGKPLEFLEFDE